MAPSVKFLPFLFLITIIHSANLTGTTAQPPNFLHYTCTAKANGNYTSNSTYRTNLNTLLTSVPSTTTTNYGFSNTSAGQDPDTVNAIGLCRGDVSAETCRSCVSNATLRLRQLCPNQKEAIGWYDFCMLRYSDQNIFHRNDGGFIYRKWNNNNVTSVSEFNSALRNLTDRLRAEATAGGSLRKFATGNVTGPDFLTIYGLMQCTPDLSASDCGKCLDGVRRWIPRCCNGKEGARVLVPSCNVRFEVYSFYEAIPAISLPLPPTPPPAPVSQPVPPLRPPSLGGKNNNTVIVVVVPIVSVVMLAVALICLFMRKPKKRKPDEQTNEADEDNISTIESLQYKFSTISSATNGFSVVNKLGQGGFGPVYKGMLQNGIAIAVKRLSKNSSQGEIEFKNEVLLVSRLQHRNLVKLLGFSLEGTERLLIYEFVPNASLDHILFDSEKRSTLDWETRFKVIEGVARGLLYLHEDSRLRIIHRDLKASNVLLDAKMNAKIADFGMARMFTQEETQANTNRIVGTYGYMAPEYAMHGQFSMKSDVFSFGVLVLEIVSGRRNHFRNGETMEDLLSYAWKSWRDGASSDLIIDPTLLAGGSSGWIRDMIRCIHIGLLCVQENIADRPTMGSVILMLSSSSLTLQVPSQPAFFMGAGLNQELQSEEHNLGDQWSVNEVSLTELDPR